MPTKKKAAKVKKSPGKKAAITKKGQATANVKKKAKPVKKAVKKAVKKVVKKAVKKVVKKAAKKATKKVVKKVTKKAIKKTTNKAVKKVAKKATKKVVKKVAKKVVKKAAKASVKKAVKKTVKKAVKKAAQKVTKKVIQKKVAKKIVIQSVKPSTKKGVKASSEKALKPTKKKASKAVKAGQKIDYDDPRDHIMVSSAAGPLEFVPYEEVKKEEYMSDEQVHHFKQILYNWKSQLMVEVDSTVVHLQQDAEAYADPLDRAAQEEGFNLELRTRDRERKLIKKIEQALDWIEEGVYGYCEDCGAEIGVRRLEARPTAAKCIDCKTYAEIREKQVGN